MQVRIATGNITVNSSNRCEYSGENFPLGGLPFRYPGVLYRLRSHFLTLSSCRGRVSDYDDRPTWLSRSYRGIGSRFPSPVMQLARRGNFVLQATGQNHVFLGVSSICHRPERDAACQFFWHRCRMWRTLQTSRTSGPRIVGPRVRWDWCVVSGGASGTGKGAGGSVR